MIQAFSDSWLKASILESKTFQCNTKEKLLLSAFPFLFFRTHLASVFLRFNELPWVSSVWAAVSSVTELSVRSVGRIFGTTAPGPAHCNKHKGFILSFPEIYRGAAWHLGTVTASVLVDGAGRNMLLEGQFSQTLQWHYNRLKWGDQALSTDWGSP